jgi:hypothetical protein
VGYGLGVDLGTSFTRAAISRDGQVRMVALTEKSVLLPSVVMVSEDGTLTVGDPGHPDDDPTRIGRDFKRRVGDPTPLMIGGQPHSAVSLLAATLRSVIDVLTLTEGEPPTEVVLSCPAVWGPYRREHFIEVPRQAGLGHVTVLTEAGLGHVTVITEPEAAVVHYAARQQLSIGDAVLVYDLGGGTFDTTVARMTDTGVEIVGVPEGVEWVGGIDFDEAVLTHVDQELGGACSLLDPNAPADAVTLRRIREECIQAKERLSQDEVTTIPVPLGDRPTQVRLTRVQFEAMITPALEATLAALHRSLQSAELPASDLAGVLLVGGSSRIPLVARLLSQNLGLPVMVDPHPQHIVALGAAEIAGARLAPNPGLAPPRPRRSPNHWLTAVGMVAVLLFGGALIYHAESRSPETPGYQAEPDPSGYSGPTGIETSLTAGSTTMPTATATRTRKPAPNNPSAPTTRPTRPTTTKPRTPTTPAKALSLPRTGHVIASEGSCLDIANGQPVDGREIQVAECNATSAQIWNLAADHTVRALGKCMQVTSDNPELQVQSCTDSDDQRWTWSDRALVNAGSGQCLEIAGTETGHGTPLALAPCADRKTQTWTLSS